VLENKVRRSLKESAALESLWKTPITSEMLVREWQRMARRTRLPDRLIELSAVLGDDPFLFQETVVRAALADRLARGFFAQDASIHAAARREIEVLRARVDSGELHPLAPDPRRSVVEIVRDAANAGPIGRRSGRVRRSMPRTDGTSRRSASRRRGPGSLVVAVRRVPCRTTARSSSSPSSSRREDRLRVATYSVPKRSFEDWFSSVQGELDEDSVVAAARSDVSRPVPATDRGAAWSAAPGTLEAAVSSPCC